MKILALDISTTTTGFAILNEKLKLLKYGQFSMKERGLSDTVYAHAIKNKVKELVEAHDISDIIIEDVYFGKNIGNLKTWCRVHGAVGDYWYEHANREPAYMQAVTARKLNDIHGQCTKIEVQLEMGRMYHLIKDDCYYDYCGKLGELLKQKKAKKLTKNKFDYRIKKISKDFEDATGISEHIADSILLGLAFLKDEEL